MIHDFESPDAALRGVFRKAPEERRAISYRLTAMNADPAHPTLVHDHAPARIEYAYDDAGNRTMARVLNAEGTVIHADFYSYDERNRLLTKETPYGTLTYSWDDQNNLTGIQSDNPNGTDLCYAYDPLNRVEQVLDAGMQLPPAETHYSYDLAGNLQSMTTANGVTHTWTYDTLNRLTNVTARDGLGFAVRGFTYTLSASGQRTQMTELTGRTVDYTYDGLYRLTSETISGGPGPQGHISYTYDQVGNRLTRTSGLIELPNQSFSYDNNDRLTQDSYDDQGNTTAAIVQGEGVTDTYSFRNRLIHRVTDSGQTIDILYDANGVRVWKSVNSGETAYLTDTQNLTGYAQVFEEHRWIAGDPSQSQPEGWQLTKSYAYFLDLISVDQALPVGNPQAFETSYYLYDVGGHVKLRVRGQEDLRTLGHHRRRDFDFHSRWANEIGCPGD